MRPVRVQLIRTHWTHWGAYSGINQFARYVDPSRYSIREQLVSDGDQDFPVQHAAFRSWLKGLIWRKTAMDWYKLSDLWAETKALPRLYAGRRQIIHYLDADHTALFLPKLKALTGAGTRIVASYHQPAEILAKVIPNDVVQCLDRIIVVAPEQASYFEGIVPADRVRLILHGIDTDYFRPLVRERTDTVIRCLTVGFWLRDFEAIRQVALSLSDQRHIEFHVVTSQDNSLEHLSNVVMHRGIEDGALRTLYQEADILFLPLLNATANNALLEGLASGLPVISTRLPSVEAYVGGAEVILVDRNDPEHCLHAIRQLAADAERRKRMGRSSRERAEELDWRGIARQYESAYSD